MLDNALFAPVTDLKGVGTKTAADLGSLGIYSIYDLLFYFPFRYDELQTLPLGWSKGNAERNRSN